MAISIGIVDDVRKVGLPTAQMSHVRQTNVTFSDPDLPRHQPHLFNQKIRIYFNQMAFEESNFPSAPVASIRTNMHLAICK